MNGQTITILIPETLPNFDTSLSGTRIGTARYAECLILERRLTKVGSEPRLEYHKTTVTARVWILSESADTIAENSIGIATMTEEGYYELTAVIC